MRRLPLLLLLFLVFPGAASAEDAPSPSAIQDAIQRGADWLTSKQQETFRSEKWHDTLELTMYTLAHTNVDRTSEVFQEGLRGLETCRLAFTYRVAMLAMALEHLNPWLYRQRLVGCAQWLVDTQLEGGEWGYPGSIQGPDVQPTPIPADAPEEGEDAAAGRESIVIERGTDPASFGGAKGDFSNTQFAILGLRACRDAKIEIPRATWQAALDYMLSFQQEDGGWGYVYAGEQDGASYASLTCAGIVGTAICLHALGKTPKSHSAVKKALTWLAKHWDPTKNVGLDRSNIIGPSTWQYYHLYSVERVGEILRLDKLGRTKWYPTGAAWLLGHQNADGSWKDEDAPDGGGPRREYLHTADTCFAILFLARATPALTGR